VDDQLPDDGDRCYVVATRDLARGILRAGFRSYAVVAGIGPVRRHADEEKEPERRHYFAASDRTKPDARAHPGAEGEALSGGVSSRILSFGCSTYLQYLRHTR